MVRTQIQLPEDQLQRLREVAAEEGISVSELVRRGVTQLLANRFAPSRDELVRRFAELRGQFRSDASDVSVRHDDYLAEAYGEW